MCTFFAVWCIHTKMRTYMILCILVVVFIRDPTAGVVGCHTKNCEDSNCSQIAAIFSAAPGRSGGQRLRVCACVCVCVFVNKNQEEPSSSSCHDALHSAFYGYGAQCEARCHRIAMLQSRFSTTSIAFPYPSYDVVLHPDAYLPPSYQSAYFAHQPPYDRGKSCGNAGCDFLAVADGTHLWKYLRIFPTLASLMPFEMLPTFCRRVVLLCIKVTTKRRETSILTRSVGPS